jgi:hypothetical protein
MTCRWVWFALATFGSWRHVVVAINQKWHASAPSMSFPYAMPGGGRGRTVGGAKIK